MAKLKFKLTQKAYNALCGLAYRIADNAYMIERYGADGSEIERKENHKTICGLFNELDVLGVPFWVQNAVICWSEDWRAYKTDFIMSAFRGRYDVDVSGVTVF